MGNGIPFKMRKRVIAKTEGKCYYCGVEPVKLTMDHVIPKSKGGKNIEENLVAACRECNHIKADMTLEEFIEFMASEGREVYCI